VASSRFAPFLGVLALPMFATFQDPDSRLKRMTMNSTLSCAASGSTSRVYASLAAVGVVSLRSRRTSRLHAWVGPRFNHAGSIVSSFIRPDPPALMSTAALPQLKWSATREISS
jgi:hypothetical protein